MSMFTNRIEGLNTDAVKVDGSAVTQPISGSVTVLNTSIPVTGTFWQATQPVSGTFWQATQPVSGTVAATQSGTWNIGTLTSITNPVAVTGTFFQAIQPVSGTVTANQGTSPWVVSLASTTVTGTVAVTQSTSPWVVSGTVTSNSPTSSSDTVTQITSTGANQTLLAANAARKRAILYFESGIWSVKFGAVASATSKTYVVSSSNTTIEIPIWVGQIDALCTTSGKLVDVTELV